MGKDDTETGDARVEETGAGTGGSLLQESMAHRDALTRFRRSEAADGRLNDVANGQELVRAMGPANGGGC